jgi:dihydroorotase-like cyclic amidohydrolase
MSKLVIENGYLVTPDQERPTKLWLKDGAILYIGDLLPANLGQESAFKSVDASGCYVTPGLIDLQMNGGLTAIFGSPSAMILVKRNAGAETGYSVGA